MAGSCSDSSQPKPGLPGHAACFFLGRVAQPGGYFFCRLLLSLQL